MTTIADSARHQDADVGFPVRAVAESGGAHRVAKPGVDLRIAERHRQGEHIGRSAQPPHVAIEQERLAVVGPQCLVHAFAVQEPVVEHRNHRVLLIEHAAVDIHCG
jgi:hypothetical protein